ncbi:UBX domain-containing protein 1 SAPK substrate protein 1 [Trichostrongylus colubriformis]|uniref:UBX domain-containing protein 1 SAPK substrate protein 1 n=1 Tax=Trichostrongylus colubriformis TaxID=6319 RepID=A0AAN8FL43_TRICO
MSTVVDQLVDMGFERARAEYAYAQTGNGALEQVMDWLISHEGEEIPSAPPAEGTAPATTDDKPKEEELTESTPGSYKCNDCNKLFRDENGMMFHAAKSGHENFSESTEVIASLTPEQRAQKAAELRDRIRAARAIKEEQARKEEIEKERRRREEGKRMLETREKQKEMELRAIAEERRRAKQEEAAARQRVLDQIKLDREARKAKASGLPPPEPSAPVSAPATAAHSKPTPKTDYKEAMIQVRLPSGQAVRQSFGASEPLSAVRLWLEINHSDGMPFSLLMPFPRKLITEEDYDKPLKELGLVPSANFVMTR